MKCGAQLFWALLLSCWLQAHSFSHHVADAGKLRGSSLSLSQAGRRWFKNTDETVGVLRLLFCSIEAPAPAPAVVFASSPVGASPGHRVTPVTLGLSEMQGPMVQTALRVRLVHQGRR